MMMKLLRSILVGVASLLFFTNLAAKSDTAESGYYTQRDREFYLTADEIFFIRPGLDLVILDVAIPADMRPEVTFSLKDPGGLPLDINGVYTPGDVSLRYTITYIPLGEEQKVRLTSGTSERHDRNGTLTEMGDGVYKYKFDAVLPDTYQPDATHTVGLGARRDLTDWDLDRYSDDALFHFVPSGMFEPVPRDVVTAATCNGRCHDPLAEHGGRYQQVQMCTQCHNPQLVDEDTGLSYSFNVLIHRLHAGADPDVGEIHYPAPLNDCEACHTGGAPTDNFPVVASPNPVPVCDGTKNGKTKFSWDYPGRMQLRLGSQNGTPFATFTGAGSKETGEWVRDGMMFYAVDLDSGDLVQKLQVHTTVLGCVGNAPGTFRGTPGAQHTNWLDHPSRLVCGSCHDDVNFETGDGHGDLRIVQPDDSACALCHQPDTGVEFDASIRGAHLPVYQSAQFPGVLFGFIDIVNTAPGQRPSVTFSLSSKNGPLDPAGLDRLRLTITGPNTDWSYYHQETVGSQAKKAGPYWTYTFATPIPANAQGSYTVSVEGRAEVPIDFREEISDEDDVIEATLLAFPVTGNTATARRSVVGDYNCEGCHANLAGHGGGRTNVHYCNTCHAPQAVAQLEPQESYAMKFMTHKIHRGADLENGYVVVRSRGVYDFSDIIFPGDLRNCRKCHVNNSYQTSLPAGLLATPTPKNWWSPMQPVTAACLSCHDGDDAAAHAFSNATFFGEACGACHGEGMSFAVDKVHAR